MKKSLPFIFLILFIKINAQEVFYRSKIITKNNDTISGYVSSIYDSKFVRFKKNKTDKITAYSPNQLRGFVLDDIVFESRLIDVPIYKNKTFWLFNEPVDRLARDSTFGRIKDTLFVQKLIKGKINLYKMTSIDGFKYYFLEKNKGLEELPPHYYTSDIDSASARLLNIKQRTQFQAGAFMTYNVIEKYDYMEVLANALKEPAFLNIKNKLNYAESTFIDLIGLYNRRNGEPNGGLLKTKLARKVFYGANIGLISLIYDPNISDTKLFSTFAFKAYGLYPLTGVNKNVSAKFAVNYYTYENETYKKAIPSASFGLRLNSITGFFRPYLEGSLGVSALLRNSRPIDFGFPLTLEVGGLIPIKDHYLTIGLSRTPIVLRKLNGYEFWSYHIGILF